MSLDSPPVLAVHAVKVALGVALLDFDHGFAAAFLAEDVAETLTFRFVLFWHYSLGWDPGKTTRIAAGVSQSQTCSQVGQKHIIRPKCMAATTPFSQPHSGQST